MNMFPLRTWIILAGIVAVVVLALAYCGSRKDVQTAADRAVIADGRMTSAQDAIETIGDNAAANTAVQAEVKDAQDAIRAADPVDRDRVARQRLRCLQRPDASC